MELMMELNRHIPSTLYIKDTFDYMYISYTGQPTTCNGCGDLRHKIRECKKQTGTGSNAIELDSDSDSLFETNMVRTSSSVISSEIPLTLISVLLYDEISSSIIVLSLSNEMNLYA